MPDDVIPQWDQLPDLTWKEKLGYLTWKFLQMEQTPTPVEHLFENGNYIREMRIPAGTLFIGRSHKHGHEVQLLSGRVIHITETGRFVLEGPLGMKTQPGYHMVAFILTDVVARSIHPCGEERDIQKLEDEFFEPVESMVALGKDVSRRVIWQA